MSIDTLTSLAFGLCVSLLAAYGLTTLARHVKASRLFQDLQMAAAFFVYLRKAGAQPAPHRFHFATSAAIVTCQRMIQQQATVVSRIGTRIGF